MNFTDEQLVKKYKSGDASAFDELYLRYNSMVKYFARNLFLLGADSEDLIQEGMLGLIKAVNSYNESESTFKTYATLCIKSSLYTAVKKYSAFKFLPLNNSDSIEVVDEKFMHDSTPEELILIKENGNELSNYLNKELSKTEKEILDLYLGGFSYVEIAAKTDKNVKAIDNALQRVRKKIAKHLGV